MTRGEAVLTCANCGTANVADLGYCEKCGQPLAAAAFSAVAYPAAAYSAAAVPAVPGKARMNRLAVASFVLGLVSLFPPFVILAIVFGHVARAQIRKSAGRQRGGGLALAGLILGYLWLGFILFLLLVVLPSLHLRF